MSSQSANQTASDVKQTASNAASDLQKEGSSLIEQGTNLLSDTLSYAQQQAQGILGQAKNTDASKQASQAGDDLKKNAKDVTDSASKEGQANAESAEKTLHDLTDQARHLVGDILHSTNEYIKPQEAGDQAQGEF